MSDQKQVMQEMLANAVHFGHKTSKWNPKMAPYIFSQKNGVYIFDLNKTYAGFEAAKELLRAAAAQKKTILFVSTKQQAAGIIQSAAEECGCPYVTNKWIPGLLTNFKTIRSRVRHMQKLREQMESGEFEKYTKKEALEKRKEIEKLETALGGVESLDKTPSVVFFLDVVRDRVAAEEAKKIGATVVAVCDTNANPGLVDCIIPGNDDALKSINFFVDGIKGAIKEGNRKVA